MSKTTLTKTDQKTKRVIYFDYLRIIAIFIVIFLHTASQNYTTTEVGSFEWAVFNVYDGLARWGVPIFVMISGALFLKKEQPIGKLYKKNILRMLIILLSWSILYALSSTIAHRINSPQDFIFNVIKGPGHLWFLYMIIGLYMATPLLRRIIENKKYSKYFMVLAIIFSFLIPRIIEIINIWQPSFANTLSEVNSNIGLNLVLGYTGYFMLGYIINETKITKKTETILYILGFFSLVFSIISTHVLSNYMQEANILFYNNLSINILFVSIGIFVFFKKHLNHQLTGKREKRLIFLSKCSLGVYLIHMLLLNTLKILLHIDTLSFNPVISVPTIAIAIYILSYIISIIINRLPFFKTWLV